VSDSTLPALPTGTWFLVKGSGSAWSALKELKTYFTLEMGDAFPYPLDRFSEVGDFVCFEFSHDSPYEGFAFCRLASTVEETKVMQLLWERIPESNLPPYILRGRRKVKPGRGAKRSTSGQTELSGKATHSRIQTLARWYGWKGRWTRLPEEISALANSAIDLHTTFCSEARLIIGNRRAPEIVDALLEWKPKWVPEGFGVEEVLHKSLRIAVLAAYGTDGAARVFTALKDLAAGAWLHRASMNSGALRIAFEEAKAAVRRLENEAWRPEKDTNEAMIQTFFLTESMRDEADDFRNHRELLPRNRDCLAGHAGYGECNIHGLPIEADHTLGVGGEHGILEFEVGFEADGISGMLVDVLGEGTTSACLSLPEFLDHIAKPGSLRLRDDRKVLRSTGRKDGKASDITPTLVAGLCLLIERICKDEQSQYRREPCPSKMDVARAVLQVMGYREDELDSEARRVCKSLAGGPHDREALPEPRAELDAILDELEF